MLLCPLDVSAQQEKEIFRPLEVTFPALARVDNLIRHLMKPTAMTQVADLVCEKKSSTSGDEYGVGAVWSVWVTTTSVSQENGTSVSRAKHLFEVKSVVPNQKVVLETRVDTSHQQSCCASPPAPPSTVEFTTTDKGKHTGVTETISGTIPSFCQIMPRVCLFCPCLWPECAIAFVCAVVCAPCCRGCAKSTSEKGLRTQCDQGLSALKAMCENGPENQVMKDGPGFVAAPPAYGGGPSAYGGGGPSAYGGSPSPAYGDGPSASNVQTNDAFCSKCGNQYASSSDPFCGKCGAPR